MRILVLGKSAFRDSNGACAGKSPRRTTPGVTDDDACLLTVLTAERLGHDAIACLAHHVATRRIIDGVLGAHVRCPTRKIDRRPGARE